jgi:hypothetical protein
VFFKARFSRALGERFTPVIRLKERGRREEGGDEVVVGFGSVLTV